MDEEQAATVRLEGIGPRLHVDRAELEAAAAVADTKKKEHATGPDFGPHVDLAADVSAVHEGVDIGLVGRHQHVGGRGARHVVLREVTREGPAQQVGGCGALSGRRRHTTDPFWSPVTTTLSLGLSPSTRPPPDNIYGIGACVPVYRRSSSVLPPSRVVRPDNGGLGRER